MPCYIATPANIRPRSVLDVSTGQAGTFLSANPVCEHVTLSGSEYFRLKAAYIAEAGPFSTSPAFFLVAVLSIAAFWGLGRVSGSIIAPLLQG